jgi:hypothetical protein
VHGAEEHCLGSRIVTEFGSLRGSHQHQPGATKARHQLGIGIGNNALSEPASGIDAHPFRVQHELLDDEGHAGMTKGTPANGPVGACAAISAAAISGSVCRTALSWGFTFATEAESVIRAVIAKRNHSNTFFQKYRFIVGSANDLKGLVRFSR